MSNSEVYYYDDDTLTDPGTEEESEIESDLGDSPADGHFERMEGPPDQCLQSGSATANAHVKTSEAAEQRTTVSAGPSHISEVATSPSRPFWQAVETPLQDDAEAPPPDYESATAERSSRLESSVNDEAITYGIAEDQQQPQASYNTSPSRPEASQAPIFSSGTDFLMASTSQGPQRMSDSNPQQPPDEETGLLGSRRKPPRGILFGRLCCCRSVSFCKTILHVAIVVLIVMVISGGKHGNNTSPITIPPAPSQPGISPDIPSNPACPFDFYSDSLEFEFRDVQNFTFLELMSGSSYFNEGISGQITVRPATTLQDADIKLWVSYATTKPWHVKSSNVDKKDDAVVLNLPQLENAGSGANTRTCMGVFVRIEVKPGVTLANWQLSTDNLNIVVGGGLFERNAGTEELSTLTITDFTRFDSIHGNVSVGYWSSRETEINLSSGSIEGSFALLDLLSLKAQSGSIDVSVDPKEADAANPKPASFLARTSSGSIDANFPTSGTIPSRNYISHIETSSGSIDGSYYLGSETIFHTNSASIKVDLLPIYDSADLSKLHVSTSSGEQAITILPPYQSPGSFKYPSEHKFQSTSGSLKLKYPQEWEGYIEGETLSGSVDIKGRDVKKLGDDKMGSWYRHFMARKGEVGKGRVGIKTTSGSVNLLVGDE